MNKSYLDKPPLEDRWATDPDYRAEYLAENMGMPRGAGDGDFYGYPGQIETEEGDNFDPDPENPPF